MPLIKARAHRVDVVHHGARLLETNRDTLRRYATFIKETPDYVLNRLIETTIAKDREFLTWLAEHPGETVAEPTPHRRAHRDGSL